MPALGSGSCVLGSHPKPCPAMCPSSIAAACSQSQIGPTQEPSSAAKFSRALLLGFGVLVCMCSLEANEMSTLKLMLDL